MSDDLIERIATTLCQYGRVTRDMPSPAEIERALPYAKSIVRMVLGERLMRWKQIALERRLRLREVERQLTLIGERAVVDWDDETVGKVDAVVPHARQRTYSEWLRGIMDVVSTGAMAMIARRKFAEQLGHARAEIIQLVSAMHGIEHICDDAIERESGPHMHAAAKRLVDLATEIAGEAQRALGRTTKEKR